MNRNFFALTLLICCACSPPTEVEQKKDEFDQAVIQFQGNLSDLDDLIESALEEIQMDLGIVGRSEEVPVSSMTRKWENSGTELAREIADIEGEFNEVTAKMEVLFNLLSAKLEESSGHSLYDDMKRDGEDARRRYDEKLEQARALIAEIEATKTDIEGFGKVVEYYAILGKIERGIKIIENIIFKLQDLNERLKTFSAN